MTRRTAAAAGDRAARRLPVVLPWIALSPTVTSPAGRAIAALTELKHVNRELKQLRAQLTALEERRAALLSELAGQS
jgi:hypothetical protein